jgi:hypothetical protein
MVNRQYIYKGKVIGCSDTFLDEVIEEDESSEIIEIKSYIREGQRILCSEEVAKKFNLEPATDDEEGHDRNADFEEFMEKYHAAQQPTGSVEDLDSLPDEEVVQLILSNWGNHIANTMLGDAGIQYETHPDHTPEPGNVTDHHLTLINDDPSIQILRLDHETGGDD